MLWFSFLKKFLKSRGSKRRLPNIIKYIFVGCIIFVGFIILVVFLDDMSPKDNKLFSKEIGDRRFFRLKIEEEKPTGTPSNGQRGYGLNLLLINNIQTEGYVKEMLELYKDSSEGKLDNCQTPLDVSTLLGIQVNETGRYPVINIPKSYIPLVGTTIQWKKPYGNLPAEAMTLRTLNKNVIRTNLPNGISPPSAELPYTVNGINPSVGSEGWQDVNSFQVRYTRFGDYGGSFPKSTLNGYNTDDSRLSDPFYLPDNLAYLNTEVSQLAAQYNLTSQTPDYNMLLAMMYSIYHNGGPAVLRYHASFGVGINDNSRLKPIKGNEDKYLKAFQELLGDFKGYSTKYNVIGRDYGPPQARVSAVIGLISQGWKLGTTAHNKITTKYGKYTLQCYRDMINPKATQAEVNKFFDDAVEPLSNASFYGMTADDINGNTSGDGSLYKIRDTTDMYKGGSAKHLQFLNVINVGHIHSAMFSGPYVYATMLKYAGVGIDPTNPADYMNNIKDEWVPNGDTDWMKEHGLDPSTMTPGQIKVFNEGYKHFGSWYAWGGKTPGIKNAEGDWLKPLRTGIYSGGQEIMKNGFDCSGLSWWVMDKALGVDIKHGTYAQIRSPLLKTISESDLKPGDLVFNQGGSDHVGFYVRTDNGRLILMQALKTGTPVGILPYKRVGSTGLVYKRYEPMFNK